MGKSKEGTEMINSKQEMTNLKMKKWIEKMRIQVIVMVYFGYHLVKAHVQTVQNMYGKGGVGSLQGRVTAARS